MNVFENYISPKIIKELHTDFTEKEIIKEIRTQITADLELASTKYNTKELSEYKC